MEGYTTGQLSTLAGVGVETVRYYERRGLLPAPPRSRSGYRQYDADALRRIAFIRRAQGLGFTLAEIGELLALRVTRDTCSKVEAQAATTIARVDQRIGELRRMKEALGSLIQAYRTGEQTGDCPIIDALESAP